MPDPRLNCAAGVCCDPPEALTARVDILRSLGVPESCCEDVAKTMPELGIAFTSTDLMKAVSEIADHPALGGR